MEADFTTRTPSLERHFAAEARNNAWANHRLLAACCRLSQEEFLAPRASFFPSIKATLNHILTVDWFYLEILERSLAGQAPAENPGRHFDPEEPFDTCRELSRAQHEADARLVAFCDALDAGKMRMPVVLPRREGVVRDSVERILAHLFQHDIHHRGQVHAMLAGTSVRPPQLDEFYCANEAHLRAEEFRELGFSEEDTWR
ncbi:MAG TPA: DinB family protein [Usitatibacter sp.]|nr:DinB family protein [Usitatibacter sp.]